MEDPDDLSSKTASLSPLSLVPQASSWSETRRLITDMVEDAPLGKILNKRLAGFYVAIVLWVIWKLISLSEAWSYNGKVPSQGELTLHNYFSNFEGYSECNLRAVELYSPPPQDEKGFYEYGTFCHDRKQLLKALSEGGRVGFDAPYRARGEIAGFQRILNSH